jgi:hypothetical protein
MSGKARRLRWTNRLLAGACAAGLTAGCASTGANHNLAPAAHDPLLGGPPIAPAQASATPGQGPATQGVPPLPVTPSSSTSIAALASSNPNALDPQNDLRIGSNRGVMPAGWQGQGTPSSVVLSRPEMGSGSLTNRDSDTAAVVAATVTSTPRASTLDRAYAELANRGVKQQKLERVDESGQWHFICWVPNPQNPAVSRRHEATAADQLAALQAVIDKIDQERQATH